MMEEAAGDAKFDPAEIRAAFAELDGLKRALGRSSFTALEAAAPVQPQRLLGARRAEAAARPILSRRLPLVNH